MNNKIILFVLLSVSLSLVSCRSLDIILNPNNYVKRDHPIEKEYIYDTVILNNNNGTLTASNKGITGIKPSRQLIFTNIGQSYTIKNGEVIEIISKGINFAQATFDVETNEETNEIKIKLVDKELTKIYIQKKCQSIIRTGINVIPKIEVAKDLNPEQIVITPIFDDICNVIGYQIRYGSVERGCKSEAAEVLKRFNECAQKTQTINNVSKIKINERCRLRKKLGLPCN